MGSASPSYEMATAMFVDVRSPGFFFFISFSVFFFWCKKGGVEEISQCSPSPPPLQKSPGSEFLNLAGIMGALCNQFYKKKEMRWCTEWNIKRKKMVKVQMVHAFCFLLNWKRGPGVNKIE